MHAAKAAITLNDDRLPRQIHPANAFTDPSTQRQPVNRGVQSGGEAASIKVLEADFFSTGFEQEEIKNLKKNLLVLLARSGTSQLLGAGLPDAVHRLPYRKKNPNCMTNGITSSLPRTR